MKATDYLDFSKRRPDLRGRDQFGRLPMFTNDGVFVTATDGASGAWGFAQQYWALDPGGQWHPDADGTVLTQVIFTLDSWSDWCVASEKQWAQAKSGNLFLKYQIDYPSGSCKFCTQILLGGPNIRSSSGVAQWREFDEDKKLVAGPSDVPWSYDVILSSSGVLDEDYHEKGQLAYARVTAMAPNVGDVQISDEMTGLLYSVKV